MLRLPTKLSDELEDLIHNTIGGCIAVHRTLGPGLVHRAQLLSYLRVSKLPVGLLVNFNVATLQEGLHRMVL